MSKPLRYFLSLLIIAVFVFLAWYFKMIVAFILIAIVISFIGNPLVVLLGKIPVGKRRIPRSVNTLIALLLVFALFLTIVGTFVPLLVSQASMLSSINYAAISARLSGPLKNIESYLSYYGVLPSGQSLFLFLKTKMESVLNFASFSNIFTNLVSIAGTILLGIFSVLFMSFFLIKDEKLFSRVILLVVPQSFHEETNRIMSESRRLLTRYFVGLCLEIGALFIMLSIGLSLAGVKNAILIAFFASILNIIPYLGYYIGAGIGVFVGLTGLLASGVLTGLATITLVIFLIFIAVKLIDDLLLQPMIYSSSVKAHPLEIYLVIMIAGTLAGIPGMILAIPLYTVIRVIAREFFSHSRLVRKLTENL